MVELRLKLAEDSCTRGSLRYLRMQPDETLASWARRHGHIELTSDSPDEYSFGRLIIDLPSVPLALQRQLQRAVQPPDAWLLREDQRRLVCARCLAEDWSQGIPSYERRAWCVAWRTCCSRHGPFFDRRSPVPLPSWVLLLEGPRWAGREADIILKKPFLVLLSFNLGADRRAIHLEAALAGGRRSEWFPKGLTKTSLREIYSQIVSDLLGQFHLERRESTEQLPNPGFNNVKNSNRFAINVLAEAILSVWTDTPLPTSALALRTPLLVRAIGWGERRSPFSRRNQVLFPGPSKRKHSLARYAEYLRAAKYARLTTPEDTSHCGYLTLPEARLIGLNVSGAVDQLTHMTKRGQFMAFNARIGSLTENIYLPLQARVAPELPLNGVILPHWAYSPLARSRQSAMPDELLYILAPRTEAMELRLAARRRRHHRLERRKSVRFCPKLRSDSAASEDEISPDG
ncbi:MAG TPA: hypothetical protein VGE64_13335 [Xanthomonadaceae bacterium]